MPADFMAGWAVVVGKAARLVVLRIGGRMTIGLGVKASPENLLLSLPAK